MAPQAGQQVSISTSTSPSTSGSTFRRQSSSASSIPPSTTSPRGSPRVQLIPHERTASFDVALTDTQRALLQRTYFDQLDLSSKDFDFEDIFTYDKPQKKLPRVVEVTTPAREQDWGSFSFSHYTAAVAQRAKVNRSKSSISEKYVKNQTEQAYGRKS